MIPEMVYEVAASIMLIGGALLSVAAGIGLLRFPDALSRMHAATKPQIFGLILVLAAIALDQHTVGTIASLLVVLVFQMLTAPISAHMIGPAGYRNGDLLRDQLVVDELDDAVARAAGEIAETTEGDVADLDVSDLPVGSADALAVEMDRVGDSSGSTTVRATTRPATTRAGAPAHATPRRGSRRALKPPATMDGTGPVTA